MKIDYLVTYLRTDMVNVSKAFNNELDAKEYAKYVSGSGSVYVKNRTIFVYKREDYHNVGTAIFQINNGKELK